MVSLEDEVLIERLTCMIRSSLIKIIKLSILTTNEISVKDSRRVYDKVRIDGAISFAHRR